MASDKSSLAALVGIALVGFAAVMAATSPYGVGVSAESETYIAAARNFAGGKGLSVPQATGELAPLTQHAPLYAFLLGGAARLGADPVDAARWIGALCFGGLALVAGLAARALTKRWWLPPLVSTLMCCSIVTLNVCLTALSEAVFLLAAAGALALLALYHRTGDARLAVAAGACCAAGLLTRYAGIAVALAGAFSLIRYDRSPRRRASLLLFAAVSAAPSAIWSIYMAWRAGNPVHREFAVHPISAADVLAALRTVSTWLLPAAAPGLARAGALVLVAVWLGGVLWRARQDAACNVFVIFLAAYAMLIAVSKSFFDSAIPMDDRILSPLFVAGLLGGALALDRASMAAGRRWRLAAPALLVMLAAGAVNLGRCVPTVLAMRRQGREYTGAAFRRSRLAEWLRTVDSGVPIYSNVDSAVRFLRPGFSGGLPAKADTRSGRRNPLYPNDMEQLHGKLQTTRGVVVYFINAPVSAEFLPSLGELEHGLGLKVVARGESWVALRPES